MGVQGERGVRGGDGWIDALIIALGGKIYLFGIERTLNLIEKAV